MNKIILAVMMVMALILTGCFSSENVQKVAPNTWIHNGDKYDVMAAKTFHHFEDQGMQNYCVAAAEFSAELILQDDPNAEAYYVTGDASRAKYGEGHMATIVMTDKGFILIDPLYNGLAIRLEDSWWVKWDSMARVEDNLVWTEYTL